MRSQLTRAVPSKFQCQHINHGCHVGDIRNQCHADSGINSRPTGKTARLTFELTSVVANHAENILHAAPFHCITNTRMPPTGMPPPRTTGEVHHFVPLLRRLADRTHDCSSRLDIPRPRFSSLWIRRRHQAIVETIQDGALAKSWLLPPLVYWLARSVVNWSLTRVFNKLPTCIFG